MDLYAENILDHYRHPRMKERIDTPTVVHEETNHSCGDALVVDLVVEGDRLTTIGWSGTGCAISQAAMSMLAEELAGKNMNDLEKLRAEDVYDLLGVPVSSRRMKCALLGLLALKNAQRKNTGEPPLSWNDLTV